ncbi:MAG: alcohol dehydrogenase [Deltaproteobacteria bacterium]|nr:MAG: alcohol dehydrogenase [Deltaproteobacteria bacterium]
MRAIRIAEHGGPEVLERVDLPDPEPGADQVRVRVSHVGLNHLDVWVRRGVPGHRFPLPLIPGSDIAGVREDTGEPVVIFPAKVDLTDPASMRGRADLSRSFKIRGENTDGGCCEVVLASPHELLPLGELDPGRAASLPLSLLTAWHMLVGRARIAPGQTVLVQAGAGGVASLAIQIAVACGARVFATASTPAKRALCEQLGAERAVAYEDTVAQVKAWTGGEGVDLVVEHVGAATWAASIRAVRWGGTVVTCGATAGHEVRLNLRALFFKQLSLLGSTMGTPGELAQAWSLVQAGRIQPVVDEILPMSELGRAHERIEAREVLGKLVVSQDLG